MCSGSYNHCLEKERAEVVRHVVTSNMVTIVPGEHIILTFEIPWQRPGQAFRVRNFMLFSRGYYHLYEGESTESGPAITVQPEKNHLLYKGGIPPFRIFNSRWSLW